MFEFYTLAFSIISGLNNKVFTGFKQHFICIDPIREDLQIMRREVYMHSLCKSNCACHWDFVLCLRKQNALKTPALRQLLPQPQRLLAENKKEVTQLKFITLAFHSRGANKKSLQRPAPFWRNEAPRWPSCALFNLKISDGAPCISSRWEADLHWTSSSSSW